MDLWTIFVSAGARLCLNTDSDRLHYLSNSNNLLRQIPGVQDGIVRGREFERQTIIDNVSLPDDATLREINRIIVEAGHKIVKKKRWKPCTSGLMVIEPVEIQFCDGSQRSFSNGLQSSV